MIITTADTAITTNYSNFSCTTSRLLHSSLLVLCLASPSRLIMPTTYPSGSLPLVHSILTRAIQLPCVYHHTCSTLQPIVFAHTLICITLPTSFPYHYDSTTVYFIIQKTYRNRIRPVNWRMEIAKL